MSVRGISVIICCYNSALRITKTLQYLVNQKVDDLDWEVIVVDNVCKDNTVQVVTEFAKEHPNFPLKIVKENEAGLSYARERGIHESKFDIIVFCDDDNWLADDYLSNACNLMFLDNSIGVLGANISAVFDGEEPIWFSEYSGGYAIGEQAATYTNMLEDRKWVFGAGMVLSKKFLDDYKKIGFKTLLSDRVGKKLSSGGDSEYCFIAQLLGYRVVASNSLKLQHFIPVNRLNLDYARNLYKGFGASMVVLDGYEHVLNKNRKANLANWFARVWYYASLISPKQLLLSVFYPQIREMFFNKAYVIMSLSALKSFVSGGYLYFASSEQAYRIQQKISNDNE